MTNLHYNTLFSYIHLTKSLKDSYRLVSQTPKQLEVQGYNTGAFYLISPLCIFAHIGPPAVFTTPDAKP